MTRRFPPPTAGEPAMLTGWLEWQRATVRRKCDGLSDDQAYEAKLSTSPLMTVAGVVSHLRWTEWGWFAQSFPDDVDAVEPTGDRGGWQFEPVLLTRLLDEYDAECGRSRRIVAALDLDDLQAFTPPEFTPVSLRWIVTHMVDETARPVASPWFRRLTSPICYELHAARAENLSLVTNHPRRCSGRPDLRRRDRCATRRRP